MTDPEDVVFDVATPNADGTELEIVGQIQGRQNLIDFLVSIAPTMEDADDG